MDFKNKPEIYSISKILLFNFSCSVFRDTKKKLNEAKSQRLKERYQLEYSQIHRNVNRMVRNDKRSHMDSLAEKAEEAANKGEQGNLYKITKIICGKNTASSNIPVKDKLGNLLTSEIEQEQRWTEHFSELLQQNSLLLQKITTN